MVAKYKYIGKSIYCDCIDWIRKCRLKGLSWDQILLGNQKDKEALERLLKLETELNFWSEITVEDWKNIIEEYKDFEGNRIRKEELTESVLNDTDNNGLKHFIDVIEEASCDHCIYKDFEGLLDEELDLQYACSKGHKLYEYGFSTGPMIWCPDFLYIYTKKTNK